MKRNNRRYFISIMGRNKLLAGMEAQLYDKDDNFVGMVEVLKDE